MTDCSPYAEFDELISMLRAEGHGQVAQRLHSLLHEVAWTNGSELMGELGLEIVRFQRGNRVVSPELQRLTGRCMAAVRQVWPRIEKVR
jgi:hypothetical protein